MAIIHVTEAEAARDLSTLIDKVRAGESVQIESGRDSFALTPILKLHYDRPRLASDILADLKRDASTALLPEGFAELVAQGIHEHEHETLKDSWESF
jgi:antitoxin (DNA-binding transcriptional repressor) of toxin-antitoxin stability system